MTERQPTVIQINLPDQTILTVDEAAHCLRMYPTADGARIELTVNVATNRQAGPISQLSATVSAQRSASMSKLEMCTVTATNLVQPNLATSQLVLVGNVSSAVLRAAEEYRQSGLF